MAKQLLWGTSVLGEAGHAEKHCAHRHQLMQYSDNT